MEFVPAVLVSQSATEARPMPASTSARPGYDYLGTGARGLGWRSWASIWLSSYAVSGYLLA